MRVYTMKVNSNKFIKEKKLEQDKVNRYCWISLLSCSFNKRVFQNWESAYSNLTQQDFLLYGLQNRVTTMQLNYHKISMPSSLSRR